MEVFIKQPADTLDYGVDLTKWISTGDAVASSSATVFPSGLSISVLHGGTIKPTVWASGGVDGTEYQITLTVVTTGGRRKEFEFKIVVTEL